FALIQDCATAAEGLHGGDHAGVHPATVLPGDGPGLDKQSTPGTVNQSDRHAQVLVQPLTEVKQRSRKAAPAACDNGFGTALYPIRLYILGWLVILHLRHQEKSNLRVVRGEDLLLGLVARRDSHLHVRLATTDPHIPDEDVVKLDYVFAADGHG